MFRRRAADALMGVPSVRKPLQVQVSSEIIEVYDGGRFAESCVVTSKPFTLLCGSVTSDV